MSQLLSIICVAGVQQGFFVVSTQSQPTSSSGTQDIRVQLLVGPLLFSPANITAGTPNTGFAVDLLNAIEQVTNFNFIITPLPDLSYPKQQADGSWDGSIVAPPINDEADLVGVDLTQTAAAEEDVDFLVSFFSYTVRVLDNPQYGINNRTQYVIADTEVLNNYLYNSGNATLQAIYDNILAGEPGSIVSDIGGVDKVLTGNYAYIVTSPFIPLLLSLYPGKFQLVPGDLGGHFYLSFATQKNSPIEEAVNHALLKLTENGTMKTLLQKYYLDGDAL